MFLRCTLTYWKKRLVGGKKLLVHAAFFLSDQKNRKSRHRWTFNIQWFCPHTLGPKLPQTPTKKGIPSSTVGETSGVSSRGMWVGSQKYRNTTKRVLTLPLSFDLSRYNYQADRLTTCDEWNLANFWVAVSPSQFKHMVVKLDHFPN